MKPLNRRLLIDIIKEEEHQGAFYIPKEEKIEEGIARIQNAAISNENIFEQLMEVCKHASLGQITEALFEVGGQYRRNM